MKTSKIHGSSHGIALANSRRHPVALATVLLVLFLAGNTSAASAAIQPIARDKWVWPISVPHPIVRPFVAPETAYSAGHRGIDISAPTDSVVRSPADGIIHFSGFVVNRNVVSINHGNGVLSSFEPVLSSLTEGDLVLRGEPIGTLQPGHCATSCLHLGVRVHGQYLSPMNFLGEIPRSVLLPTRVIQ